MANPTLPFQIPDMALTSGTLLSDSRSFHLAKGSSMAPGIYDLSIEAYHQGTGISGSALLEFKRSPYHYWYKYKNPDYIPESPAPAQILGHALHTAILEPEKFEEQFVVLPKVDKRTKAGTEKWKQLQEEMGNRSLLTEAQYEELQEMKASFEKNTLAVQLIKNTQIEQSIYWNDPDLDILCKYRPDILHNGLVVDLKTAQDGVSGRFLRPCTTTIFKRQWIRAALQSITEIDIKYFYSLRNQRYMSNRCKQNQNQKSRRGQGLNTPHSKLLN